MIKISFRTQNDHYLVANDSSSDYRISATPNSVGQWETFTIIPADGRDGNSITSGSQIHIQTQHGRYVMAREGGGGVLSGEATLPSAWETFTIEKLAGAGEIVQGDRVTLRASNGRNFVMARDGGGGDVTAESSNRLAWETFRVEFFNPIPVRLKALHSQYLSAEGGGGGEVTATRNVADIWESFVLVNRSRRSGLRNGDKVWLQVYNGSFVTAEGGGGGALPANRPRAASWETFTIAKASGGEISLSDSVSFGTQNALNYVMALNGGGGLVNAASRQAREWETFRLIQVRRSIAEVYRAYRADLGSLTGSEVVLSGGRGRYQLCANGIIIEDPVWGAFELHGETYRKFLELSTVRPGAAGFIDEQLRILGYPRSDVRELNDHRGVRNYFERGLIVFRPDDPLSAIIYGDFYEAWRRATAVGYPRLDRLPMRDGRGTYQLCDHGMIYQTAATGAHAIYGDVWQLWENWTKRLDHDPDRSRPEILDPLYDFSSSSLLGNSALGYPIDEEHSAPDGSRLQQFEFGSIRRRLTEMPPLRFFAQNMALLVAPGTYGGTERDRAIQALIEHLHANQYEVVGLSECFANAERRRIWNSLRDLYPHTPLEGPNEADIESDGGLLLMSHYPILERHQTIYRQAASDDRFANKGVLHARIQVPGLSGGYDVFLSHMQNPDPGPDAVNALKQQWAHLSAFIRAYSSGERPSILMGDLNTDALNTTLYNEFRRRLNFPQDLWLTNGDGSAGITIDRRRSFNRGTPPLAVNDPERYRHGNRVDYILSWSGLRYASRVANMQVLHLQSSVSADGLGRDLSDHYGIEAQLASMSELAVEVRRPITRVQVEMVGFRCLEVTMGFADVTRRSNPDEPFFELRGLPATGARQSRRSSTAGDVDNGEIRTFSGLNVAFGDPGDFLDVQVAGWEHDDWPGDDDNLGTQSIRLSRSELLRIWSGSMTRVLPLLTGDNSQYAVTVLISVS